MVAASKWRWPWGQSGGCEGGAAGFALAYAVRGMDAVLWIHRSQRGRLCRWGYFELTRVSCSAVSFQCGTGDGDVTKPISLSIAGSTWTMERIVGGAYPEPPKIDCEKNLALPLSL